MDEDIGKPWEVLRSEPGPDWILFQTRYVWVRNPRNAKSLKAVILEAPGWVNIVALTWEKNLVIVKQFRCRKFGSPTTSADQANS